MNKKWIWMCLSLMLPISLRAVAHDEVGSGQTQRSAVSLSEFGKNASGITTYSLRSDNAPVQDVLRILFSRKGDNNYAVSDTVNGVVSMNVRGVTLDEALTLVQNMTPSIRIVNGIIVKSARDPKEIAARIQAQLDNKYMTPAQSSSLEQAPNLNSPLNRQVTLSIPDSNPTTLSQAIAMIEKQTRVPFRLDSRVPADVKFIASVTNMPLTSLLDKIAPGNGFGALKWVAMNDYVLIAPADRVNIVLGNQVLGSTILCSKCNQPLNAVWSFCPICGQTTQRGLLAPKSPLGQKRVPE